MSAWQVDTEVFTSALTGQYRSNCVCIDRSVQKGSLLIDSSTIDPSVSQQMAKESSKAGATFVDAPVSGGR